MASVAPGPGSMRRQAGASRLAGQVGADALDADLPGRHRRASLEAELPVYREHCVVAGDQPARGGKVVEDLLRHRPLQPLAQGAATMSRFHSGVADVHPLRRCGADHDVGEPDKTAGGIVGPALQVSAAAACSSCLSRPGLSVRPPIWRSSRGAVLITIASIATSVGMGPSGVLP